MEYLAIRLGPPVDKIKYFLQTLYRLFIVAENFKLNVKLCANNIIYYEGKKAFWEIIKFYELPVKKKISKKRNLWT